MFTKVKRCGLSKANPTSTAGMRCFATLAVGSLALASAQEDGTKARTSMTYSKEAAMCAFTSAQSSTTNSLGGEL
jgi:hypothetical protein